MTTLAIVLARAASHASWSQLRSLLDWQASQQASQGLVTVSEEAVVSPLCCSLSLALSFPIVVGGCMVLQEVEVSQITKTF